MRVAPKGRTSFAPSVSELRIGRAPGRCIGRWRASDRCTARCQHSPRWVINGFDRRRDHPHRQGDHHLPSAEPVGMWATRSVVQGCGEAQLVHSPPCPQAPTRVHRSDCQGLLIHFSPIQDARSSSPACTSTSTGLQIWRRPTWGGSQAIGPPRWCAAPTPRAPSRPSSGTRHDASPRGVAEPPQRPAAPRGDAQFDRGKRKGCLSRRALLHPVQSPALDRRGR